MIFGSFIKINCLIKFGWNRFLVSGPETDVFEMSLNRKEWDLLDRFRTHKLADTITYWQSKWELAPDQPCDCEACSNYDTISLLRSCQMGLAGFQSAR